MRHPLAEEFLLGVGAVNFYVTIGAALVDGARHVVWRGPLNVDAVASPAHIAGAVVTLQTKCEHHRACEHPGVCRAVRDMAGHAAIHSHGRVLEHKRAALIGVAIHARLFVGFGRFHVTGTRAVGPGRLERSVWIMAIGAVHETFIHAVLEGHGKLRPHIQVAAFTQRGLRFGQ